jgi:hypothetical protein
MPDMKDFYYNSLEDKDLRKAIENRKAEEGLDAPLSLSYFRYVC